MSSTLNVIGFSAKSLRLIMVWLFDSNKMTMVAAYEVNRNTANKNNVNVANRAGMERTVIDKPEDKHVYHKFG